VARKRQKTLVRCIAAFALAGLNAAADETTPNQAANSHLVLTATVLTERKDMREVLGLDPGDNFIVVKVRAAPNVIEPMRLSSDDFTLISRKNGERSPSMRPVRFTRNAKQQEFLNSKLFPDFETRDPVEGLLYFLIDGKFQPKNLGLIYQGAAGRLIIDFK
jgi:hypothetical protein